MNERDFRIIEFVLEHKIASHSMIRGLFFPKTSFQASYNVMKRLVDYGELQRERSYWAGEYVYWIPGHKPKQVRHALLVTDFYCKLYSITKIVRFEREFTAFDELRPDAFVAYERVDGKKYIAFIEVEISGNSFNLSKYVKLYESEEWKQVYPVFPLIVAITNKKHIKNDTNLKLIQVNEDFAGLKEIINST